MKIVNYTLIDIIVAIFDTIHDDAANNCNQSPVEPMPYVKTLTIQNRLANVCPNHSKLRIFSILVILLSDNIAISFVLLSFSMLNTPDRSMINHLSTSPILDKPLRIRQFLYLETKR